MWFFLRTGYWIPRTFLPDVYSDDALICFNSDDFGTTRSFGGTINAVCSALGGEDFYHWEWRFHVGMWAAASASKLEGDFVECGVSHGFLSSAIMQHLDWDRLGKTFYLLDTFGGMDPRFVTEVERETGALDKSQAALDFGIYANSVDSVRANFAEWQNVRIIAGTVPETLDQVDCADGGLPAHRHELRSARSCGAALLLAAADPGRLRAPGRLRQSRARRTAPGDGRSGERIGRVDLHACPPARG